jgi:serine/threonine protein kinase
MSPKEKEQLQAELSILRELRHPNIVQYHEREHLKATQDLHLYMEYCGNGDLGQVIKKLKAKEQWAQEEFVWSIFSQLVSALYRCHYGEDPPDAGRNVMGLGQTAKPTKLKSKQMQYMVLHRDLKPENGRPNTTPPHVSVNVNLFPVFLDEDNSVKLGDFGLSKILQSHDFASTYVGTPYYMSPEICAAERYSLYSDIWSLGCLLYELCAKEPPFNARTHIELFNKIKIGHVKPIPPVYSGELQKVISSCLQVNPNSRPDTAQLLNLPVVKLMRKEQEVVLLGRQMKKEKDLAEKRLHEANERMARLDAEKEGIRAETEATVRREWEVKARLEIDRQVKIEVTRLEKIFETEVSKRVAAAQAISTQPARSSTPVDGSVDVAELSQPDSMLEARIAGDSSSDFNSQTDISSLSLESPPSRTKGPDPTKKKTTRTPFARAQTMFVNNVAPSPMDVQMVDPSPMSIKGLSLSPRRNGNAQTQPRPSTNIFAAAEERWKPTNASSLSPNPSDAEHDSSVADDEDEDDDVPGLPSPTRDPFKVLNKRPNMMRQKTAPSLTKRMPSAPNLFGVNAANSGANIGRKLPSSVPIVATSPARKGQMSPSRPRSGFGAAALAPGPQISGSPVRKTLAKEPVPKGKTEGMIKTAMRNTLHGRTLVELSQARAGGVDRSPEKANMKVAVKITEMEPPVWDPENDEMPSPFLVRGGRMRTGMR